MTMQFNEVTGEHIFSGTKAELNNMLIKNQQRFISHFNALIDCAKDAADLADFKRFHGDWIREEFFVDGRSEKRIFNLLKNMNALEGGVIESDGKLYQKGFSVSYANKQICVNTYAICEITPEKPKKEDAKDILLTAAMRESFAQKRATDKQIAYIAALCKKSAIGAEFLESAKDSNFVLTKSEASFAIKNLQN